MRKSNFSEFIWFLILVFFEGLLFKMLISERIFLIISINMKKYIWLALFILLILIIIQFFNIFSFSSRKMFKGGYLIFIFALGMIFLANSLNINEVSLNLKGVKLSHESHEMNEHEHSHSHENLNELETLVLSEENFHNSIEELIAHLDEFIGKEISIEGLFYKNKDYAESEFAITQIDMNCCIVDSTYLGVLCSGDMPNINNGQEVKVKGIVQSKIIKDSSGREVRVPFINIFYADTLQ